MSKKATVLFGFVMLFSSCNNEGKSSSEIREDSNHHETASVIPDSLSSGCYAQIAGRDTAHLQLENIGPNTTGKLSYAIYEKDRNDGTVQGEMSGDILKGWYLFKSEGIISVRQVAWKIKGTELWPGTGEMIEKNDTMFFSLPGNLQYDNTRPFKKVDCVL